MRPKPSVAQTGDGGGGSRSAGARDDHRRPRGGRPCPTSIAACSPPCRWSAPVVSITSPSGRIRRRRPGRSAAAPRARGLSSPSYRRGISVLNDQEARATSACALVAAMPHAQAERLRLGRGIGECAITRRLLDMDRSRTSGASAEAPRRRLPAEHGLSATWAGRARRPCHRTPPLRNLHFRPRERGSTRPASGHGRLPGTGKGGGGRARPASGWRSRSAGRSPCLGLARRQRRMARPMVHRALGRELQGAARRSSTGGDFCGTTAPSRHAADLPRNRRGASCRRPAST
jgi:hypothetical protein